MATEIEVFGKVQRVGFRKFVESFAKERKLSGHVYNRRDRSLYILVDGPEDKVKELVSACRYGPTKATVRHTESRVVEMPVEKGFKIIRYEVFGETINRVQKNWLYSALKDSIYSYGTLGHKETSYALLKSFNYPLPSVYGTGLTLQQGLSYVKKHGQGFLKPVKASASRGCIGIVMDGPFYLNVMTGEILSEETLVNWLKRERRRFGFGDKWRVEQLMQGDGFTLPRDIKFYCFSGKFNAISIMERIWDEKLSLNMRWFTPEWEPIDNPPAHSLRIDNTIEPIPYEKREAYESLARDISVKTLLPFTRVDLYETSEGPLAGELTPDPASAFAFTPEWHQRFLVDWKRSVKRMEKFLMSPEGEALKQKHVLIGEEFRRNQHG